MIRSIVLLLVVLLVGVHSYSIVPKRRMDQKTGHLLEKQKNQNQPGSVLPPGVKPHTYREELPGKHRNGAWFLKPQHKAKQSQNKAKAKSPGGRQFAYGKVSWW